MHYQYDVIDRLLLARTTSDAWSLSLGPGLCLDWRRTGKAPKALDLRELWLTAHFTEMKEAVVVMGRQR